MNLTDRPTPLTDAIFNTRHSGYAELHDHARRLEQLLDEMAEACEAWEDYDWHGGANGLSLVDVREKIAKTLEHYAELKGESK